ncbi:MAG: SUMF1/EgtB/PvdO family nonheme iron enzyme [Deltaproteobacteria bacterium]|nr:SUMF1/EgtB/PvdO family nonheme iron enzyme [Deltaproteobacteria bacterium]
MKPISGWFALAAVASGTLVAVAADPELRTRAEAEVARLRALAARSQSELPGARKRVASAAQAATVELPALRASKEACEAAIVARRAALAKEVEGCRVKAKEVAAALAERAVRAQAEFDACTKDAAEARTTCDRDCTQSVKICKQTSRAGTSVRGACLTREKACKEVCTNRAEHACDARRVDEETAREAAAAVAGSDPCVPLVQQRDALDGQEAACGASLEQVEAALEAAKAEVMELEARVALGSQASESYVIDAMTCGRLGMAYLPAGTFTMGDSVAKVKFGKMSVAAFCIDRAEVTTSDYAGCVALGKCSSPGPAEGCNAAGDARGEHPINCVDWQQATTYCESLGLRLPTEEEWEYAARGIDARVYPWGNEPPRNQLCWDGDGNHLGQSRRRSTCVVQSHASGNSPYGLADMAGNVAEWTSSLWAAGDDDRVTRGGSWTTLGLAGVRAAVRDGAPPTLQSPDLGFRCARSTRN